MDLGAWADKELAKVGKKEVKKLKIVGKDNKITLPPKLFTKSPEEKKDSDKNSQNNSPAKHEDQHSIQKSPRVEEKKVTAAPISQKPFKKPALKIPDDLKIKPQTKINEGKSETIKIAQKSPRQLHAETGASQKSPRGVEIPAKPEIARKTPTPTEEHKKPVSQNPFSEVAKAQAGSKPAGLIPVKLKKKLKIPDEVPAVPHKDSPPKLEEKKEEKKEDKVKKPILDPSKLKFLKKPIPVKTNGSESGNSSGSRRTPEVPENFPLKPAVPVIIKPTVKKEDAINNAILNAQKNEQKNDDDEYKDDFEDIKDENVMASIQRAIKRENEAAAAYFESKQEITNEKVPVTTNFTKAIIISNDKMLDKAAKAEQERRLEKVKEHYEPMEEIFDPILELRPEGKQDRYFSKLAKGAISNMLVQTQDDAVSMEVQTEEINMEDKWQNAPLDYAKVYKNEKKEYDDTEIEIFLDKMMPLIETVISQPGDEGEAELSQGKKSIVENKGELNLTKEIIEKYNIAESNIISIFCTSLNNI